MTPPLFHGPKLKVERAKHHISDLHERVNAFQASHFYQLLIEHNAQSDKNAIKVTQTKPIPDDLAVIIGDAIQNLKSALDFSISDILFKTTGKRSKHAKFPVYNSRDSLVGAIKGGDISEAPQEVLDHIVNAVKPYREHGNYALCALHDLNILDKHMLLLPVVHFGVLSGLALENDRGEKWTDLTLSLEAGTAFIPQRGKLKITTQGEASAFLFFDKGLPMENRPIIDTLIRFEEILAETIEQLEGFV